MTTSRKTRNGGCACRVPLSDVCMPQGLYDADALNFLADRGIDVKPDHMGRLSIPVSDAQSLWDEAAKVAAAEVAARAQAERAAQERLSKLAARRQETFEGELYAAAARGTGI